MGKIDYKKILEKLVKDDHHALDKIEKVIADSKKNDKFVYASLSFKEIVNDKEWDASEKERLLRLFGYEKYEQKLEYTDEYDHKQKMDAAVHMIKFNNLSGFTAYMNCFKDIESHYKGTDTTKDESYRHILDAINNQTSKTAEKYTDNRKVKYSEILNKEQELEFIKVALSILSKEDKKRLCADFYEAHCLKAVNNRSIFINIIKTGNIELIDEYVPYVDNISAYLSYAVDTGNIEVVRHFIADLGADVNYYPKEVIYGLLTPLKRAITNNDYEMVEFLYNNGADINLSVLEEDFMDNLHNTSLKIFDRWNHVQPNSCKEDDKDVKDLQYLRTSTPLKYATTISNYEQSRDYAGYLISFEGNTNYVDNRIEINNEKPTEELINRAKIINLLFEKADKSKGFDATDLLCTALITQDTLNSNKYIDYIIANKMEVDVNKLFNLFLYLKLDEYEVLTSILMKFIEKYSKSPLKTKNQLLNMYLEKTVKYYVREGFVLNNFTSTLLNDIDNCDRKSIILMPYVKDVETAKKLIEMGFDINQTDENGKNILFRLLCYRYNRNELTVKEKELFEFLTTINKETKERLVDIMHRDKDNKNALYYALRTMHTEEEYRYGSKEEVYTYTDFEGVVADFIDMLPEEEVNNKDIVELLEKRMTKYFAYNSVRSDRIHADFVYQHHKKLMEALRRKMIFSDKIYQEIFEKLYPTEEYKIELLNSRVQVEPTLDFVYEVLDKNTKIQKLSIADNYDKYINFLNKTNASFEEFLCVFKKLIDDVKKLEQFYKRNITKRYNVDKYLEYIKNKHNVSYNDLPSYILKMILFGIRKFGSTNLPLILELCPFFDINTVIYDEDIKMSYYTHLGEVTDYDDEGYPIEPEDRFEAENLRLDYDDNILFTGALIHYGILINDIELVKYLQSIGAKTKLIIEGEDHTWDYVNSTAMAALLEPEVGPRDLAELDEEERKYLLGL